ncbi:MAG: patatin-like phospholipase family protein [Pseudomonadota bacterium]
MGLTASARSQAPALSAPAHPTSSPPCANRPALAAGPDPRAKIGLALGGGAALGWTHIGILRALEARGIRPDIVAGTSIGAVVGGGYAAGHLDALEAFARGLTRRKVFGYLDFNVTGTGLISGQRLCTKLEETLKGVDIEDLERTFVAVAAEIGTGHELWLSRGSLVQAIRASYALPGIFRPVNVNGRWLFDGALTNPIPVSVCRALGARYVIAVNLNADTTGRGTVEPNFDVGSANATPADPALSEQPAAGGVRKLLQRQLFGRTGEDNPVPGISTVMIDAFSIVQDRISRARLAGDPPDIVLKPRLQGIGLFDFHRAEEMIARGEEVVAREADDLDHDLSARGLKGVNQDRDALPRPLDANESARGLASPEVAEAPAP